MFQQTTTTSLPGLDPTPSTEKYRVYRKELGYILGRNYRGLKKLFNIELHDALNVSNTNTEYQSPLHLLRWSFNFETFTFESIAAIKI